MAFNMLRLFFLSAALMFLYRGVTGAVEPPNVEQQHQSTTVASDNSVKTLRFAADNERHTNPLLRDNEPTSGVAYPNIMAELRRASRLSDVEALDRLQPLIATYGVNGILDAIEDAHPECHAEAHIVGRAAVRQTTNVTQLAQACGLRCHTGCFHGIALGLVADQPDTNGEHSADANSDATRISFAFRALCNDSSILETVGAGECLHAVGHTAAMMVGEADQAKIESICMAAYEGTPVFQHYCGTGAFMQFKPEPPSACESVVLPAACYMYSWRPFFRRLRHGINYIEEITVVGIQQKEYCNSKSSTHVHKAGCIFGLAAVLAENVVMHDHSREETRLSNGKKVFDQICNELEGELLAACVEGFLLRNQKYFPEGAADRICSEWNHSWSYSQEECFEVAALSQYSFDRKVERYVFQQ